MKKRIRNDGRRTDNDLRNSGNICSALARRRSHIARGVSSFTGRSARSRCRETCPTLVRMHRYSLSSSSLFGGRPPPRAFLFPRDLFWSTGKHLRQLRGGGPPPGLSYEAGAYLSRFSLACQLRVPLSASPTLPPFLILASAFTRCCRTLSTSVAPFWFFFRLLSLRVSSRSRFYPTLHRLTSMFFIVCYSHVSISYIPSSVLTCSTFLSKLLSSRNYRTCTFLSVKLHDNVCNYSLLR